MMDLTILALCFWSKLAASETIQTPIQFTENQNVGLQDRNTASGAYERGKDNTNVECNAGSQKIDTKAECIEALQALGGTGYQHNSRGDLPKGCYVNELSGGKLAFYWNNHATGASADGAIPMCKKTESLSPEEPCRENEKNVSIVLTTKDDAYRLAWYVTEDCSSLYSYDDYNAYDLVGYDNNQEYVRHCCLTDGVHDLICSNHMWITGGWEDAHLTIDGTTFCDDFDDGSDDGIVETEFTIGEPIQVDVCDGLNGVSDNGGNMCCAKSCGTCGGTGCAKRDGGRKNCCTGAISKKNKKCDDVSVAPCVL